MHRSQSVSLMKYDGSYRSVPVRLGRAFGWGRFYLAWHPGADRNPAAVTRWRYRNRECGWCSMAVLLLCKTARNSGVVTAGGLWRLGDVFSAEMTGTRAGFSSTWTHGVRRAWNLLAWHRYVCKMERANCSCYLCIELWLHCQGALKKKQTFLMQFPLLYIVYICFMYMCMYM